MKKALVVGVLLLATAQVAPSQTDDKKPAPKPCSAPEHRQFDFWLGDWTVEAKGKQAGTNSITAILGGCVLFEEWQQSSDDGKTWKTVFDGLYTKAK